jgi:hypothetical protein
VGAPGGVPSTPTPESISGSRRWSVSVGLLGGYALLAVVAELGRLWWPTGATLSRSTSVGVTIRRSPSRRPFLICASSRSGLAAASQ